MPLRKRHLRPRIPVEPGAMTRRDIRAAIWRSENREARTLRAKIGCPISEARALLALERHESARNG